MIPNATRACFWWMNDNHTFIKLTGKNLEDIVKHAEDCRQRDPYGSLCPVIVMSEETGGKSIETRELRRVGKMCHAQKDNTDKWNGDLMSWKKAVTEDPEIGKLIKSGKIV